MAKKAMTLKEAKAELKKVRTELTKLKKKYKVVPDTPTLMSEIEALEDAALKDINLIVEATETKTGRELSGCDVDVSEFRNNRLTDMVEIMVKKSKGFNYPSGKHGFKSWLSKKIDCFWDC